MNAPAAGKDVGVERRRIKRSAWFLAALAAAFYVGFICWSVFVGGR